MDKENLEYLNTITSKVMEYDKTRTKVLDYVILNQHKDVDLVTNLFVMGFLWQANKRNETLTDEDLLMLLDAEYDYDDIEFDEFREYFLDDDQTELSLKELLDLTVEKFDEEDEDFVDEDEDDEE